MAQFSKSHRGKILKHCQDWVGVKALQDRQNFRHKKTHISEDVGFK
jgi:hypothetical protein